MSKGLAFLIILSSLFFISFLHPRSSAVIGSDRPTIPSLDAQVIEPDIKIHLRYMSTNIMFYDNTPLEIVLLYQISCDLPPGAPPGMDCTVSLIGQAEGFEVSHIDEMVFTYQVETSQFPLSVWVPPDTPALRVIPVVISGNYEVTPGQSEGEVPPRIDEITVPPYGCLQMSTEPRDWNPPVGKWTDMDLTLINLANTEDVVQIDLFKYDPRIELRFSEDVIKVRKGEIKEVTFAARQRSGLPSTNRFTLRARSSYQGLNATVYCDMEFGTTLSSSSVLKGPVAVVVGGSAIIFIVAVSLIVMFMFRRKRSKQDRFFKRS